MKKAIGINVKPPSKACSDVNCPWHGKLSVRGKVLECTVRSTRGYLTATVERSFNRLVPKYNRYERRKSKLVVHNPSCISAKKGDNIIIAECRPLSKTKSFVIVGFSE